MKGARKFRVMPEKPADLTLFKAMSALALDDFSEGVDINMLATLVHVRQLGRYVALSYSCWLASGYGR